MPNLVYAGLYDDAVTYPTGKVAVGVSCEIRLKGHTEMAVLYTDRTKASVAANPVVTDASGNLSFYAAPDIYEVTVPSVGGKFTVPVPPDALDIQTNGADNLVASVNTKIGEVVLTAADVGAVATVNGKTGTAITLTAEDIGAVDPGDVVHITGSETIGGQKTFSSPPVVPTPTVAQHAARKDYVDTGLGGKVDTSRTVTAAAPLTGGGPLSANVTIGANVGTGAAQLAAGNHAHDAVVALTDAATIAVDGSLGRYFRVTLAGNRTLGNLANPVDGRPILFEFIQDGTGNRTLTLGTNYVDLTGGLVLSTGAGKRDFVVAVANTTTGKTYLLAVAKGG